MVVPSLGGTGGLERVATTLAVEIAPRVDRLVVCFARRGPYEDVLRDAGVELARIHRPRPRPDRFARAIAGLTAVLQRERPDVIHAHNPAAGAAAAIARGLARTRRTAVVTTFHGLTADRLTLAARVLQASSDAVIAVGASSTRALESAGLAAGLASTIENAVAVAATRPVDEVRAELGTADGELVVNVGRYVPEKDQKLLIDAVAELAARRPALRAAIVGIGPLENALRRRAAELGVADRILLTGPRADAVDLLAAADAVAISSRSEGLPLVLLEAMSLGKPIVATSVGSIPDVLEDGRSGLLVPSGDAGAFAAALERVLVDPGTLGERARIIAEQRFSVGAMAERTLDVYESAVAKRRTRTP